MCYSTQTIMSDSSPKIGCSQTIKLFGWAREAAHPLKMDLSLSVCVCVYLCVCESYYSRFEYAALLGIITEPPKPLSKVWLLSSGPLKTTLKIDRVVPQIRSAE